MAVARNTTAPDLKSIGTCSNMSDVDYILQEAKNFEHKNIQDIEAFCRFRQISIYESSAVRICVAVALNVGSKYELMGWRVTVLLFKIMKTNQVMFLVFIFGQGRKSMLRL